MNGSLNSFFWFLLGYLAAIVTAYIALGFIEYRNGEKEGE